MAWLTMLVWLGIVLAKGASFTGLTVSRKVFVVLAGMALVSVTVSVMIVEPNWLVSGVSVSVRLPPVPPSSRAASGTSAGFDEVAIRFSKAPGVSKSPMTTGIGPSRTSSAMVWLLRTVMVGKRFVGTGITV